MLTEIQILIASRLSMGNLFTLKYQCNEIECFLFVGVFILKITYLLVLKIITYLRMHRNTLMIILNKLC